MAACQGEVAGSNLVFRLDGQRVQVKASAHLYDVELRDLIVDTGESAKSLIRSGGLQGASVWMLQVTEGRHRLLIGAWSGVIAE